MSDDEKPNPSAELAQQTETARTYTFKPVALPDGLVDEAEELAQQLITHVEQIRQNIRFWTDPTQVPTCGYSITPGASARLYEMSPEAKAQQWVDRLREAVSVLATNEPSDKRDAKLLLKFVDLAVEHNQRKGPIWEHVGPDTPDPTLEQSVEYAIDTVQMQMSARLHRVTEQPDMRAKLQLAVAIRRGVARLPPPRPERVRQWLVPLFDVADEAELVGRNGDAKSWAETLRLWKVLKPEKATK